MESWNYIKRASIGSKTGITQHPSENGALNAFRKCVHPTSRAVIVCAADAEALPEDPGRPVPEKKS
jgi:hypothetical protein